jgi:hypothetical protein
MKIKAKTEQEYKGRVDGILLSGNHAESTLAEIDGYWHEGVDYIICAMEIVELREAKEAERNGKST